MSNVTKRKRPPNDYFDIAPSDVIPKPMLFAVIIVAIISLMIWTGYFVRDSVESVNETNRKIAEFNALPEEMRELVFDLTTSTVAGWKDKNEHIMANKDQPVTLSSSINYELWVLFALIPLFLLFVFIRYWVEKIESYYLADFPLGTAYGWILMILCLPFGWPFLLVSRIIMNRQLREEDQQAHEENVVPCALQDDMENALSDTISIIMPDEISDETRNQYVDFRTDLAIKGRDDCLRGLRSSIADLEASIQSHGNKIQKKQKKLGEQRARLAQLEQTARETESMDRQTALGELQTILTMRGVKNITMHPDKRQLDILVQIRVPYNGALYDFGDYLVSFWYKRFQAIETHSGVRRDVISTAPLYHSGNSFCFGDRSPEIREYVDDNRIVEALTLMIDCMHTVNPHDREYIPQCFKAIPYKKEG